MAVVAALLVLGGLGFFLLTRAGAPEPPKMELTQEAEDYLQHLKLANVEMSAAENYFGGMVVEIVGDITNQGDRALRQVDVNCVFLDPYGQPLRREPVSIVRAKDGLEPGETRRFRLPFDSLPEGWNQDVPALVIGQIVF
jgi:hypothetical protein